MGGLGAWARRYPMTLAESASTFAEQIVHDAALARSAAGAAARLAVLDRRLRDGAAFLLNLPMRFAFERARLRGARRRRAARPSGSARRWPRRSATAYGDALAEDELDPWFWASKLHFYIAGISFYNFPYTFGYLFSLGLFVRAKAEGAELPAAHRGAAAPRGQRQPGAPRAALPRRRARGARPSGTPRSTRSRPTSRASRQSSQRFPMAAAERAGARRRARALRLGASLALLVACGGREEAAPGRSRPPRRRRGACLRPARGRRRRGGRGSSTTARAASGCARGAPRASSCSRSWRASRASRSDPAPARRRPSASTSTSRA